MEMQRNTATTGEQLTTQVRGRIEDLFEQVPFVRIKRWQNETKKSQDSRADLTAEVLAKGESWSLFVEVKGNGEPRYVRGAVQELRSLLSDKPRTYGVVAAPYISPDAGRICTNEGTGYLDLAGNCRLVFADVFIERRGLPRPTKERRPLRTLYAPKAGRLLRVLLEQPKVPRTLQALADEARISLGLAFKVKQRLLDAEFVAEQREGLVLTRPEDLLIQWGANYSFAKNRVLEFYSPGDPAQLESALSQDMRKTDRRYAFTLFSGAARVAPYARYLKGAAYVTDEPSVVATRVGWKQVSSGANFMLISPYDQGVFYGAREIDRESVVSDVQLYLDLMGSNSRGEEAASFLLDQKLRPRW